MEKPTEPGFYEVEYSVISSGYQKIEVLPEDIELGLNWEDVLIENGIDPWDQDMDNLEVIEVKKSNEE